MIPAPGNKSWSASNAVSGSTYETTGPQTTELPTGKFGDITKFGGKSMKMSTAQLTAKDLQALYPKIAQIVSVAEEGGGGGNPIMESMKMEHAEEKHEQEIRHKEELHSITMEEKGMALQQKQEADAMKQQEAGMEMPPEPPPPLDPQQGQGMIDAAYQNVQNREPMEGPLKEGAHMQKNAYDQGFEDALVNLGVLI